MWCNEGPDLMETGSMNSMDWTGFINPLELGSSSKLLRV